MKKWQTWKRNGVEYLADSSGGIIDSDGNWYGRWQSVVEFRRRQITGDTPLPLDGMLAKMTCVGENMR